MFNIQNINPRKIFLIDGSGAFVTAFLLFIVIKKWNNYFGMPEQVVNILSLVAVVFGVYSICCFFLAGNQWKWLLRIIAIANFLYCCATAAIVLYYYPQLTVLAICYFVVEIAIISWLAYIELQLTKRV